MSIRGTMRWAIPLAITVLGYGLAAGLWKQSGLTAAQFCVLFVGVKTVLNWGTWLVHGRPAIFAAPAFLRWTMFGQMLNGGAWICYFKALSEGPVAVVQTITAAYTALAALLALLFLRERVVAIQLVGIATVIAASLMLGYSGDASGGQGPWLRDSLLTMLLWAGAVTLFKHAYNQPGSNDSVSFLANWLAMALTVLPYGLLNGGATGLDTLGLLIVFLYSLGDLTLFAAINRGPASIVSPLSGLYPIPTLVYSTVVLHEAISHLQWAAIAMVLVALILIVPEPDNPILRLIRPKPAEEQV